MGTSKSSLYVLLVLLALASTFWTRFGGFAGAHTGKAPVPLCRTSHANSKLPDASTGRGQLACFPLDLLQAGRSMAENAVCMRQGEQYSHVYVIRSFGRADSFRQMTCGVLEKLLPCLGWCFLALAADDPELEKYRENAGPWKDRILIGVRGAERQVAFVDQIMPKGTRVMMLDDNILKFMDRGKTLKSGLDDLVGLGFQCMKRAGASIWSVSDSPNPAHWSDEVDVGIGLVYGAAFGMVASHEESRYSQFGQVLDDVERSCRFYEQDGVTVRLGRLQVYKRHAPGIFHADKGGISAGLSAEAFAAEAAQARSALLQRFPQLLQVTTTKLGLRFRHGNRSRASSFIL